VGIVAGHAQPAVAHWLAGSAGRLAGVAGSMLAWPGAPVAALAV